MRSTEDFADAISAELLTIRVTHNIEVKPVIGGRSVKNITSFKSVRDFAVALERAGADATYSAGSGWSFFHRAAADADTGATG